MKVDASEGPADPEEWPPLPTHDRILVGGHTVWTGPFRPPVLVSQPNRWGVIEGRFPALPCVVEADAAVTAHLPLPGEVVGFLDRLHRPIPEPTGGRSGRLLLETAAALAGTLTQTKGVDVAATPFARTIPLVTPRDAGRLAADCAERGVVGLRPLPGLAGGVAVSVRPEHGPDELERIRAAVADAVLG